MQTLKMISDTQFESMGLAIGHVGKIKALTSEISGAQISEGTLRLWGSLLKAYKRSISTPQNIRFLETLLHIICIYNPVFLPYDHFG